jgi:hypothetical protein
MGWANTQKKSCRLVCSSFFFHNLMRGPEVCSDNARVYRPRNVAFTAIRWVGFTAIRWVGFIATRWVGFTATRWLGFTATRWLGFTAGRTAGTNSDVGVAKRALFTADRWLIKDFFCTDMTSSVKPEFWCLNRGSDFAQPCPV